MAREFFKFGFSIERLAEIKKISQEKLKKALAE
jgi:hypothetical protein